MNDDHEAEVDAWLGGASDRTLRTACARIFLAGDVAWKLKRNIDLGYADFTTLARRKWALDRELAFNRPAAPDIYRRVRAVTRESGGELSWDGQGQVVDYALEMRRFDDSHVLSADPAALSGEMAEALGRTIARYHADAPPRPEGGWSALSFTVGSNAHLLGDLRGQLDHHRVEGLVARTMEALARQRPLLEARRDAGFSRRCHGDLHLANILVENGRPVLFDCIEFNDLLSDLDVQYDLAFLLMDLDFRGRRDAAVRAHSAYLDEAARHFPGSLWDGLAALPLMLSVRAAVRAHVAAHSGDLEQSRAYVEAAIGHLAPAPPVLAAVGGFSGSGKSSFARAAAPALGPSPGAVILRTDEVRKRLLGAGPLDPLDRSLYTPEFYVQVYDTLFDIARRLLAAGRAVVLDATFTQPALRDRARALAAEAGVPFHPAWLTAPPEVLEARVAARKSDASDADVAVLRDQMAQQGGAPVEWPAVDTRRSASEAAAGWVATLDR